MPDQIMVCLSSRGPNSDFLLRYASRFAGRLNKNWYALYVQTAAEDPLHIDLQTQNALARTLTLAKQLGAIVFTYKGEDLASTIVRFAREYHVGHIIIGSPSRLFILPKNSLQENSFRKVDPGSQGDQYRRGGHPFHSAPVRKDPGAGDRGQPVSAKGSA